VADLAPNPGLIPAAPQRKVGFAPSGARKARPEMTMRVAKFYIGEVVRHRVFPFRGVIFDVDPEFSNSDEWWESIPADMRPRKEQPFYHLLAENDETTYIAYVSEQNLLVDDTGEPCRHPEIGEMFNGLEDGRYVPRHMQAN